MSKTLVAILNHNLPDYTDKLFESLDAYKDDSYDIMVMDNGSTDEGKSKYTTHETGQNCYMGGGFNLMFQYILDNKEYDSLLFMNNDLIIHGYNFVKSLRTELFDNDYTIVSPCIFQPTHDQGFWYSMHNWNSKFTRPVKWVDFMSPLIHRRFIEKIGQFDNSLIYGWGIDMLSGMTCEDNDWKVGVCDWIPALHLVALTTKLGKSDLTFEKYCEIANTRMHQYFKKHGLEDRHKEYMEYSQKYNNFNK